MAEETPHAPGMPEIRDEAADTPMWVPLVGLGLLVLIGMVAVYRAATRPEPAEEAPAAETAGAAAPSDEGAEAPAEANPNRPQEPANAPE